MAHGYLGDGYGEHGDVGDDRSDDHDRRWREHTGREGAWRDRDDWRDRDRDHGMMFGGAGRGWSNEDRSAGHAQMWRVCRARTWSIPARSSHSRDAAPNLASKWTR